MDRQRYMAELSKLLTFMFKEDRSEILQHYNELLDNAEDEQALLQEFGSPTKLAVTISRTYNREERKLSVDVDSKADDEQAEYSKPDETEFRTITPVHPVSEEDEEKAAPEAEDEEDEYDEDFPAPSEEADEPPRRIKADDDGEKYTPIFFESPEPEAKAEAEEAETVESAPEVEEAAEEAEIEEPEETVIETPEAPTEENEEAPAEPVEKAAPELEEKTEEEKFIVHPVAVEQVPEEKKAPVLPDYNTDFIKEAEEESAASGKLNPGLLILYLIFAIPIGLVLLLLLTALTFAVLGVAAAVMAFGVQCITFSLTGIAVAADMMFIIGVAIIAFGIGILLLWTAFWLIIAGFKALISGIIKLGRKICVKGAEW